MSHHSDDRPPQESEVLRNVMKALGQPVGPTGAFPQGKLTPQDEGEIRVAIGTASGKVVIDFGKPTAWIGFDKDQALAIAEILRKHAETL